MKNNDLLLIDLSKNFSRFESNKSYIYLNRGCINLQNCKQIKLKDLNTFKKDSYNSLIRFFKNSLSKNDENSFFYNELEIFNLRIDRYDFVDRITNLISIKKLILKRKIRKLKIISDNKNTLNIFDGMDLDIEKEDLSQKKVNFNLTKIKIVKFYLKTVILLLFMKMKNKSLLVKKKDEFFFSIFPNYFSYGKINFFKKEKNIFNFLLTDETHLGASLLKLFKIVNITDKEKIINLEHFIKLNDVIKLIITNLFFFKKYENYFFKNTNIEGLNFRNEIESLYNTSLINRAKLEIYVNAIPKFLNFYKIKKINLYLFEYNFGFFLIRSIREYSKKIKIVGFQHGIFSNRLTWFDLIKSLKLKNIYLPDYVFSSNKYSFSDYKTILNKKIFLKPKKNNNKKFIHSIKIDKNSNKILVLPGTHDIKEIYYHLKNNHVSSSEKVFYFKLHPKNIFNFKDEQRIKKLENFKGKDFSNVIISQTSSLVYDFLILKKKFSVIDFDYRLNLVSTKLDNKINFIRR